MNPSPRWPTDEELRLLLAGDLEPLRQAELEALLEREEVLRQQLEQLAGGTSWTSHAHCASPAGDAAADDAALLAAMARLKQPPTAATLAQDAPLPDPMTFSFLLPAENSDALGKLAHYEVQECIGAGGFGTVLKAYDPKLNRYVAIKVLAPHLAAHATARQRFLREAHAAGGVSNDHVVTIYAIEESHQPPYIVMEYVPGLSLQQLVDRDGPLSVSKIVRIGAQVAEGLAAAHQKGLIHRDIKPANILLENGVQRVKLTDFGLARLVDDAALTQSGIVAGTPQYMSPEQARGETVDYRSDLFSLGSVLYTMCTGRPAFRADSAVAVLKRVCDDQPRPVREVNPEIPAWLAAIVDKLMAKSPEKRFRSAREVSDLLERCLAHVQQPNLLALPEQVSRLAQETVQVPPVVIEHSNAALDAIRNKVRAPATWLMLIAVMSWTLLMFLLFLPIVGAWPGYHMPWWILMGSLLVITMVATLIALGSAAMRRLRFWPLAVLASILTMFLGPVPGVGLIVGIWALIVLFQRDVREAFAAVAAGQPYPLPAPRDEQQSVPAKPPMAGKAAYANSASRQSNWGVIVAIGLVLGVMVLPLLLCGGMLFTKTSIREVAGPLSGTHEHNSPGAHRNCQLTVLCPFADTLMTIEGTGARPGQTHRFATLQDARLPQTYRYNLQPGTYLVTAWEIESEQRIFEELVTVQEGEQKQIEILPQSLNPKIIEMTPTIPRVDVSDIYNAVLSADGRRVAWNVKNETVLVFDTVTGKQLLHLDDCKPQAMALSADGAQLAMRSSKPGDNEHFVVYNVHTGESQALRATGKFTDGLYMTPGWVRALAFSPDGQTLAAASGYQWTKETETDPNYRSAIHRWNLADGEALPTLALQDGLITQLVFPATKNDLLFAASTDEQRGALVAAWDLNDAKSVGRIWSADERLDGERDHVVSTPWGGWVYGAYQLDHHRQPTKFEVRALQTRNNGNQGKRGLWQVGRALDMGPVRSMAVSPDGKLLAIATNDGNRKIRLFDATNSTTTAEVGAAIGPESHLMFDLAFSPDSQELIAGSTARAFRWDVSRWTGSKLTPAEAPPKVNQSRGR